jgi:hypothetical protein
MPGKTIKQPETMKKIKNIFEKSPHNFFIPRSLLSETKGCRPRVPDGGVYEFKF